MRKLLLYFVCSFTTCLMTNVAVSGDKLSLPLGYIDDCIKMSSHEAAKICEDFINSSNDIKIRERIFYTGFCYSTSTPVMGSYRVSMVISTFGNLIVGEGGHPYFHQTTMGILPTEIIPQLKDRIGSQWSFISNKKIQRLIWGVGKSINDFTKIFSEQTGIQQTNPDEMDQLQTAIYDGIQSVMSEKDPVKNLSEDELENLKTERLAKQILPQLFRSEKDYIASYFQDTNIRWFRSDPNGDILVFSIFGGFSPTRVCRLRPYKYTDRV